MERGEVSVLVSGPDQDGRLLVGADVVIAIWRLTPGQGWLATLFGNPVVLPVTRFAYDRFADVLFAWNKRKGRCCRGLAIAWQSERAARDWASRRGIGARV